MQISFYIPHYIGYIGIYFIVLTVFYCITRISLVYYYRKKYEYKKQMAKKRQLKKYYR
ncbi:MAG: hypothetical protein II304_08855 [Bacteroidales bacterium]|nr:hypothetical protein [Bacteroidales bacterium]